MKGNRRLTGAAAAGKGWERYRDATVMCGATIVRSPTPREAISEMDQRLHSTGQSSVEGDVRRNVLSKLQLESATFNAKPAANKRASVPVTCLRNCLLSPLAVIPTFTLTLTLTLTHCTCVRYTCLPRMDSSGHDAAPCRLSSVASK